MNRGRDGQETERDGKMQAQDKGRKGWGKGERRGSATKRGTREPLEGRRGR
jgi:hypothetical protein